MYFLSACEERLENSVPVISKWRAPADVTVKELKVRLIEIPVLKDKSLPLLLLIIHFAVAAAKTILFVKASFFY